MTNNETFGMSIEKLICDIFNLRIILNYYLKTYL